jgi:hypothetical protein
VTVTRLATWPWRRAVREVRRWQQGIYGPPEPSWWPERWKGWLGPSHPHDNRAVAIFVGSERFEFLPAESDGYRGHTYQGTLRPGAADIERSLVRLNRPAEAARTLAVISSFEGGFDAIQTWDRGKFAWGFVQFTATGGLPRLLHNLKARAPAVFDECFTAGGIDVVSGRIVIRANGRTLEGRRAHNRLHDDPTLWRWFLLASRRTPVQDAQVSTAHDTYYAQPLMLRVTLGGQSVSLGELFADSEFGRAVVCDRAVQRGVGHTLRLFRRAVRQSGARSMEDRPSILDCVRALEVRDRWRLDELAREIPPPLDASARWTSGPAPAS